MIRKGDWKLIQFFESDSVELYDLGTDIGESSDLAKSNPEKASELRRELKTWQEKTQAVMPNRPNPDFDPVRKVRKGKAGKKKKAKV